MASETTEGAKVEGGGECGDPAERVRRELEEQFNVQRARMKELFLQKEEELSAATAARALLQSEAAGLRAQLQQLQILCDNQQSELQNLQLLVSETVEASSSGSEEVRRVRARNLELEQQLAALKRQLAAQQQDLSLAPATLVRSLARKLGADTEEQQPNRKNVEEGELMQSIIQPLEMEIAALKHKLRDTDTQLQDALKEIAARSSTGATSGGDSRPESEPGRQCDMCANYEKQLVSEQKAADTARERANKLDQALRMATEELEGVRSLHDETVRSWHSERAASSEQLEKLTTAVEGAKTALQQRAQEAEEASRRALELVTTLTVDRETLQKKLDTYEEEGGTAVVSVEAEEASRRALELVTTLTVDRDTLQKKLYMLERDNAALVGQYTKKAADMQNEIIDLPDNIDELQVLTLQLREQLIECAIGRERALDAENELRAQLLQQGALFHRQDAELAAVTHQLREARECVDRMQTEHAQMQELGDKLRHSNDMIEKLLDDKKRLQTEAAELRQRVSVLQQELDNSEKVQQDFVRLSQSLQVQLQRIREADTEVRWQHDEDVSECPSCHTPLPNSKKKVHCRHCGRIFCGGCVCHAVAAGPRGLPARVCAVCRTLLQPHAAPYFSTQPPRDPD